jgi:hypothetical protein
VHKETGVRVDLLPQGERPGTASRPAPTTILHPTVLGASGTTLHYMSLPALVELKLAAGRTKDLADLIELIRANPHELARVREHLVAVHADYASRFDRLIEQSKEDTER